MFIKQKVDDKKEAEIDKLKDEYTELEQTVSELRKRGKDTSIPELLLLEMPAKLTMAKITSEGKDISSVKKIVQDIRNEVADINLGSDFERIKELIEETYEHIRKDEKNAATEKYSEIMKIYKLLTAGMKKTVYSACIELRRRLS